MQAACTACADGKFCRDHGAPRGAKYDGGKTNYSLLNREVLRGVAQVLTFGAAKYAADSWQDVPDALRRYRAAQERHFDSRVLDGELHDSESGILHAWHYACNALFVAYFLAFRADMVEEYRSAQCGVGNAEVWPTTKVAGPYPCEWDRP